ncbi:MAG: protein kinase [Planctomycetaceae bacterium]|nr:protein kinase [Planctomycetaceae bacterium]
MAGQDPGDRTLRHGEEADSGQAEPVRLPAIPGIRIEEKIGAGAFGAVYRAWHEAFETPVAVKFLDAGAADPGEVRRVLAEARVMARLDHPNLLRIHDARSAGSFVYLIEEFMDGGSLSPVRSLAPEPALELARQLLSGLQALHEARILHRDIKPANCLLRGRDRRVKLADLGIAVESGGAIYETTTRSGTLPFMAPELLEEPPRYGPRTDLYALGMTLASVLLDEDPYPRASLPVLLQWITSGSRPDLPRLRPDLPRELTTAVSSLMAPRAEERPSTANEALAVLSAPATTTLSGHGIRSVPRPGPGQRIVDAWIVGDLLAEGRGMTGHAATHGDTGASARISFVEPGPDRLAYESLVLASAERACQLDHPGLVPVLDYGRSDGEVFVVTGPHGRTLEDVVISGGPLSEVEALRLVVSTVRCLEFIHGKGLVYQVVNPGGALLSADGRTLLLGWPVFCVPRGAQGRSEDSSILRACVPQYAAPEALLTSRGSIEPSVDLYGIGELLYFAIVGRPSCPGDSLADIIRWKMDGPRVLKEVVPGATAPTSTLVRRLLASQPEDRPEDASEVADGMDRILRRLTEGLEIR